MFKNQYTLPRNQKKESRNRNSSTKKPSRDDRIRTCDHTPPRRVLYRAELHPALNTLTFKIKNSTFKIKKITMFN